MNFEITIDETIASILASKKLLASSTSAGNGSVKLFMTLRSHGGAFKPEYSVVGEIDGEKFNEKFDDSGVKDSNEFHFGPYSLENAVVAFNKYARKIS